MMIDAIAAPLRSTFPDASRISTPAYLRWLSEESLFGAVIEASLDDEQGAGGPLRGGAGRARWRWRLAAPGSRYALHRSEHALAVSTADRSKGVPVAMMLKVFAAQPLDAAERAALVRAACRSHRAPMALHVGFNEGVGFRGPALPDRPWSSPLNLIVRRLAGAPPQTDIANFEFLDFDAN